VEHYEVVEIACDPSQWRAQLQAWSEIGWPVTEWPFSLSRIVPAWKEFYAAVLEKRLTHDADPGLARHVANLVLKVDRQGARPTKEFAGSGRKIDRFTAALIAWDRAVARSREAPAAVPEFFAL
jgi:phage terminase large subunit-like protein